MKQHITRTQVYYAEEVGTMFIDAADNLSAAVDKRERRTRFNNLRKRLPELKEHELVHIALGANAAGELVVLACYETHGITSREEKLLQFVRRVNETPRFEHTCESSIILKELQESATVLLAEELQNASR